MTNADRVDFYTHIDKLAQLNEARSMQDKIQFLHEFISTDFPFIDRIAVAIYDPGNGMLKTLAYSSDDASPLLRYQVLLEDAPSLNEIRHMCKPRVVNDLDIFNDGQNPHTKSISSAAFVASYTVPILQDDEFYGFLFFNSLQKSVFTEPVLAELDINSRLLMMIVVGEISNIRTLSATIQSALQMTHERDPETGAHLGRMAAYSRLIATELAEAFDFDDMFIENLTLFAPLHDLGKISIPDSILLKPGRLNEHEYEIMKTHAQRGRSMIDRLLKNYRLDQVAEIGMLQNIAECHHEAVDGSGYPNGLVGDEIPIEARIVTVADIFDALTSLRPYKEAWENHIAYEYLQELSGTKLDRHCVQALINNKDAVTKIQASVQEDKSIS
jgi:HD-GYP domain-containing protein (c-di-GMP phosphodiesterase class II)